MDKEWNSHLKLGTPIKCIDPESGDTLAEGSLTEVKGPFCFKIDEKWYEIGESYNLDIEPEGIIIWGYDPDKEN